MDHHKLVLLGLTAVVALGILSQWLAWRLKLPAILMLLLSGMLAGPVPQALGLGFKPLDPDRLLGELLYPIISLSVAIILFEGGLTLRLGELRHVGRVLRRLVTIGAAVTWIITAVAARLLLAIPWPVAILLGAVLVVTGPTVIGPLLRHVKPTGAVGPILRWEGIVIDPIGATLALLVFEGIFQTHAHGAAWAVGKALVLTVVFGAAIGLAAAVVLVLAFRRFWVADYLQNPVTLMFVLAAFTGSNLLQDESGLLAVTVMGVALANQRWVPFKHILEFKEALSVLLVSSLFVLLGSRLTFGDFEGIGPSMAAFLLTLILIARPAAVLASSIGSNLTWREKAFLCWMAPRGIVAAAVSSVFALRMRREGIAGADRLVPVTFSVIIATVLVYGLTAAWVGRWLKLSGSRSAGYLIAGANPLARSIASVLKSEGQLVVMVDTNRPMVAAARMGGLDAHAVSILSEEVIERIEGTGIGRLLAITPNEEVNSLAALHIGRHFGRSQCYQLAPEPKKSAAPSPSTSPSASPAKPSASQPKAPTGPLKPGDVLTMPSSTGNAEDVKEKKAKVSQELRGRLLFAASETFESLAARLADGAQFKKTTFTKEFTFDQYRARHNGDFVPIFLVTETGDWIVCTADAPISPKPGQSLISLVKPLPAPAQDAEPTIVLPETAGAAIA